MEDSKVILPETGRELDLLRLEHLLHGRRLWGSSKSHREYMFGSVEELNEVLAFPVVKHLMENSLYRVVSYLNNIHRIVLTDEVRPKITSEIVCNKTIAHKSKTIIHVKSYNPTLVLNFEKEYLAIRHVTEHSRLEMLFLPLNWEEEGPYSRTVIRGFDE